MGVFQMSRAGLSQVSSRCLSGVSDGLSLPKPKPRKAGERLPPLDFDTGNEKHVALLNQRFN